jgi:hypothetical protein
MEPILTIISVFLGIIPAYFIVGFAGLIGMIFT